MGAYGVQSVGIVDGFSGPGLFYQAANTGVCRGSESFSVFTALQVRAPSPSANFIAGTVNTGGTAGWYIRRMSDTASAEAEYQIAVYLTGALSLDMQFSLPTVLGRTLFLAFTYDDGLSLYVNGGLAASGGGVGAYVPSANPFMLGNAPVAAADGMVDRLISFGYGDSAIDAAGHAAVWNAFRETCSMRYAGEQVGSAGFDYVYEASSISAPPTILRPTTWPNDGAVLAGGDLTWSRDIKDEDEINFTVDSDPDYTFVQSQIVP